VWRETGILEEFPADGPKVRWRTPIGAGYTGPAVANGRVYVMDRQLTGREQPVESVRSGKFPAASACFVSTKPPAKSFGNTNTIVLMPLVIPPAPAPLQRLRRESFTRSGPKGI